MDAVADIILLIKLDLNVTVRSILQISQMM